MPKNFSILRADLYKETITRLSNELAEAKAEATKAFSRYKNANALSVSLPLLIQIRL